MNHLVQHSAHAGTCFRDTLLKDCVSVPHTINCIMSQSSNEDELLCLYTTVLGERDSHRDREFGQAYIVYQEQKVRR